MTKLLQDLLNAYRNGGVKALASEAERRMPPAGGHGWVDELIAGCCEPEYSVPASWLLLQHARSGRAIPAPSVARLVESCVSKDVGPDDARLHLAQLVQHLEVPAGSEDSLARFLRKGCASEHAFLRAWAMDGLYHLSIQYPHYAQAAKRALRQGAEDSKASVRARARRFAADAEQRS